MAIYHLRHGMVSRSTGRSSVQSAAYITGEKLHETRRDLNVNYQNRHSDIAFTTTLAPEHAPDEFHNVKIWDHFENFEDAYAYKRYKTDQTREAYLNSAQTAQTIVVALPRELSVEVCVELITQFAKERFVSRGLVVTLAMHDDEGNPHAHLQISRRAVDENGDLSWAKDRAICTKKELLVTRKLWADLTNQYLEREGFESRITEKSFADLGIQLEPTQHRGWIADKLEGMGVKSRIVQENIKAFENNRELLIEEPGTILPELTQNNATFTQLQLLKTVQKRVGDDAPLVAHVFEGALQESIVVGEGVDGQIRYTSPTYKALEEQAVNLTAELTAAKFSQPQLTKTAREDHLANHLDNQFLDNQFLNNKLPDLSIEQKQAVMSLTQDNQFSVLVGRAGAGKTTTLRAVSELYKNAGHKVLGTSLAAMAADNLGKEAGIPAATIHSLVYGWQRYQDAQDKFLSFNSIIDEGVLKQLDWYQDLKRFEGTALTNNTVLIVDEAGMVGTRLWNELLVDVKHAGAKLIAVGDDHQFKAIEAGDFFRELKSQASQANNLYELNTIYRQKAPWMKEASNNLANLEVNQALSAYEQRGHVHLTTRESLADEIASAYVSFVSNATTVSNTTTTTTTTSVKDPSQDQPTCLVLAFTNTQTHQINQAIREQLKHRGLLDTKDSIVINDKSFAIGDRIVFLENDKTRLTITDKDGMVRSGLFIKNGTQGIIKSIDKQGSINIQISEDMYTSLPFQIISSPKVAIGQPELNPTREYTYTNIAHGYAVTTHKAQGQTVDQVFVAASKNMDAKGFYVAMTRHRDDVQLFYAKEDFTSFKDLSSHLSRFEHKDLVKDYTIRPEHEEAWQRVQEYRLCVLDAAAACNQATKKHDPSAWTDYHQIKQDQITLGKEILADFENHKLYINQAGLTQEMLEITTGQKVRSLSNAEEKAKLTVELYGETAQVARDLWREIRQTHPGSLCYQHPQYGQFGDMRLERNSLAYTISENYSLHREFIVEFSNTYGINKRTVEAQSNQFLAQQFMAQQQEKNQQQSLPGTNLDTTFDKTFYNTLDTTQNTQNILEKKHKYWYINRSYNKDYGKYSSSINENTQQYSGLPDDSIQRPVFKKISKIDYQNQNENQEQEREFDKSYTKFVADPTVIKQELNSRIKDLAYQFLGQPQSQKPTEWRYGNKGSISIHVAGSKQGLYSNFETGESGNALKFIQDQLQCDHKQAFKWGAEWLGEDVTRSSLQAKFVTVIQSLPQEKKEWTPIFPAPATPVDLKAEPQLAYMLKGRQETARFTYKDADGNTLGYVVRLEDKNGHKITPTLTYCQNDKSEKQWRWQGFGNDRPLYGLDQLKEKLNATVLIVEGEKTCEAARVLFPDHAVITWSGGAGAVQKSDWSVLRNRDVVIWPDNDKAGTNAAQKISSILEAQGNEKITIVNLPPTLPHKWDLADKVPDGLNVGEILLNSHSRMYAKETVQHTALLTNEQQKDISIIRYLEAQITSEDNSRWMHSKIETLLRNSMAENAREALKMWQYITNSYSHSFIPMNFEEMHLKTQEANTLLEKERLNLSTEALDKLRETAITNPQEVIQHFRMVQTQRDLDFSSDIRKFTELSKEYTQMPPHLRSEDNAVTKELLDISHKYLNNEKFSAAIESNDLTKSVQKAITQAKVEELKIIEINRGFER